MQERIDKLEQQLQRKCEIVSALLDNQARLERQLTALGNALWRSE